MSTTLTHQTRRLTSVATTRRIAERVEPATANSEGTRFAKTALMAGLMIFLAFGLPFIFIASTVGAEVPVMIICMLHITLASVVLGGIVAGMFLSDSEDAIDESTNQPSAPPATIPTRPTRRAA